MNALLDAVFYTGTPIWKRGYAAHVRAWERHVQRTSFRLFHDDAGFRAAYHARGGLVSQGGGR